MKINKNIIASTVLVALMFVAIYGVTPPEIEADANNDSANFVKSFSKKFNLDEEEVSMFMQEIRADRFAQMQEEFERYLTRAVEDGTLTEGQMQELLDMRAMHMVEVDSFVNLSVDDRHDMMREHRNEMKIWADENGIDFSQIHFGHRHN